MTQLLEEISQISIYLKEEQERINEIALFQPLSAHSGFDESSKPIQQRKWSYTSQLPFLRRLSLKVQSFLFRKVPRFIPAERSSAEAKFKTVLALLLAQESLREFFFSSEKKQRNFFQAIQRAAEQLGYKGFSIPSETAPLKICQNLTHISGRPMSLIDDLTELNLQMAALKKEERNAILFSILSQIERAPLTSILEVTHQDKIERIALTTRYAQYKITGMHADSGKIEYSFTEDRATSSIRTAQNSRPGVKGTMNQRCSFDDQTGEKIGSYSGELSNQNHLLEQILFMLNLKGEEVALVKDAPQVEESTFLFTSLFSWHEIGLINDQHQAIRSLNRQILKIGKERYVRLNLIHLNISFNALNKYPTPAEMGATIRDMNDQALIHTTADLWKKLNLPSQKLFELRDTLNVIADEHDFLKHQEQLLDVIDRFKEIRKELIAQLELLPQNPLILAGMALLKGKKSDGKKLRGMDLLLCLNILAGDLGYMHNKNCQNSTDRSAGAHAADKAQYAYRLIREHIFLPGYTSGQELSLFKVLYSMYLVWEEPEINAALSTGFIGEKFYHNFFQKNPETTRYLTSWVKKHPEVYLGLSDQRS